MSTQIDLIVRRARMPLQGPGLWQMSVTAGRVTQIAKEIKAYSSHEIDADGALLLPGFIDAHVHLNEPGRTNWEGLSTGTKALAAGGVTTFFDMPLNSSPPCITAEAVVAKRAVAEKKSHIDFRLWGGLVPDNVSEIPALARAGVIGLKAFMCDSGLAEFPASDRRTLQRGAKACRKLGLPLAVHAEDPETLAAHQVCGPGDWQTFARSRPEAVELAAVTQLLHIAEDTGVTLHIVHVSSPEVLRMVAKARKHGLRVTCETCPHYLLLNETAMATLGGRAKCAPPLRPESTRRQLWTAVESGLIHTIGSDHSPAPPAMKSGPDFLKLWGGISGAQHGMLLFLQAARRRGISWPQIHALTAFNSANLFALKHKGSLAPGYDADFVILEELPSRKIEAHDLFTRHPLSPYIGKHLQWKPTMTLVRGGIIYQEGMFPAAKNCGVGTGQ